MAFKRLGAGVTGDLVTDPLYNFGIGADQVIVDAGSGSHAGIIGYRGVDFGLSIRTGAGNDVITTLDADAGSNQWIFSGSGDDRIFGGAANETVFDGSGSDIVRLGDGEDVLYVGAGNDGYDGGAGLVDWLNFAHQSFDAEAGAELETNSAGITVNLGLTTPQDFGDFGIDTVINFENVVGSRGDDVLIGNSLTNRLIGGYGDDALHGKDGNDHLFGDLGSDVLVGGRGRDYIDVDDRIESAAVRDRIVYESISDSGLTYATRDVIQGFDGGGLVTDDKIDLSAIDASIGLVGNQSFYFVGNNPLGAPAAAGVIWFDVQGDDSIVYVDNDSDFAPEMSFLVEGVTGLTAQDFIL